MRLIDADAADVEMIVCYYGDQCRIEDVQEWLDDQPTIDAAPVRRGEWLEVNPMLKGVYQCSACGTYIGMTTRALTEKRKDHYCSECGADMRGEKNETR